MTDLDAVLREMDFEFFGEGKFKTSAEKFLGQPDAVLVDLRADEERALVDLPLRGLVRTIPLPLAELPDRWEEIPADCPVGLLCSSHTRSAFAYLYLRARGRTNARILLHGYDALLQEMTPGKVRARLRARKG